MIKEGLKPCLECVFVCVGVCHREKERVEYGSQKGLQAAASRPASVWLDANFGQLAPRAVTSEVGSKSPLQKTIKVHAA